MCKSSEFSRIIRIFAIKIAKIFHLDIKKNAILLFCTRFFVSLQKNIQSMKEVELKSVIQECQMEELSAAERQLLEQAIEATSRSYAP